MKVIAIASGKGGSSKSTLTASLAVIAASEGDSVAMIDLNRGQSTLTTWAERRGGDNPQLVDGIKSLLADVRAIRASRQVDWLFIDTPPLPVSVIEAAVVAADYVVIPVRTSSLDTEAVAPIVEVCGTRKRRFGFVLAAVIPSRRDLIATVESDLEEMGEILGRTSDKASQVEAMAHGKAGFELDKSLRPEIARLWSAIKEKAGA